MLNEYLTKGAGERTGGAHLEGQRCGEAVRRPGHDPQRGLEGLFDRRARQQAVLSGEENQQDHIPNQSTENRTVLQRRRPRSGVWRAGKGSRQMNLKLLLRSGITWVNSGSYRAVYDMSQRESTATPKAGLEPATPRFRTALQLQGRWTSTHPDRCGFPR